MYILRYLVQAVKQFGAPLGNYMNTGKGGGETFSLRCEKWKKKEILIINTNILSLNCISQTI